MFRCRAASVQTAPRLPARPDRNWTAGAGRPDPARGRAPLPPSEARGSGRSAGRGGATEASSRPRAGPSQSDRRWDRARHPGARRPLRPMGARGGGGKGRLRGGPQTAQHGGAARGAHRAGGRGPRGEEHAEPQAGGSAARRRPPRRAAPLPGCVGLAGVARRPGGEDPGARPRSPAPLPCLARPRASSSRWGAGRGSPHHGALGTRGNRGLGSPAGRRFTWSSAAVRAHRLTSGCRVLSLSVGASAPLLLPSSTDLELMYNKGHIFEV